jgi:hypothetical protein
MEKADQQAATIRSAFDPKLTFGRASSCKHQTHNCGRLPTCRDQRIEDAKLDGFGFQYGPGPNIAKGAPACIQSIASAICAMPRRQRNQRLSPVRIIGLYGTCGACGGSLVGHGCFIVKMRPIAASPHASSDCVWVKFRAPLRSAPLMLAMTRPASRRSAPRRLAPLRSARSRWARVRLAPLRLARARLAPRRLALNR